MVNLRVYDKAYLLVLETYKLIESNQLVNRDFAIKDQLRRASISVLLNIAEGYGRSKKQFQWYLKISSGSANETKVLLMLIQDIYKVDCMRLIDDYDHMSKSITKLRKSMKD